jgi:2,4-dienoyl-CoA reductase-like NADH-dependent reductase (Old Yellow Enzyme family)
MESIAALRRELPDSFPLFVRLSCTDWAPEGVESWTLEQSVELARRLKDAGADLIDCSSGGLIPHARIKAGPGYQVPFAETLRREAAIPTAAVGMIDTAPLAASIVAEGRADMVLTARQSLRDPYFPLHAARELGQPHAVELPGQYLRV